MGAEKTPKTSKIAVSSFILTFLLWGVVFIASIIIESDWYDKKVSYDTKIFNYYLLFFLASFVVIVNIILPIKAIKHIKNGKGELKGTKYVILSFLSFMLCLALSLLISGILLMIEYA